MAQKIKCLTDGGQYHTQISKDKVSISVSLPFELNIDKKEAKVLTRLLHNQMELVLRSYWKKRN